MCVDRTCCNLIHDVIIPQTLDSISVWERIIVCLHSDLSRPPWSAGESGVQLSWCRDLSFW